MGLNRYHRLEGAIDLHLHPGPTISPRRVDFIEAAEEARAVGMRALVYKPLYFVSMDAAYAADRAVEGLQVFGGVTLDNVVGGLSVQTVTIALRMNARFVWMPLFDSEHTRQGVANVPFYKDRIFGEQGLRIVDEHGTLLPEVDKILDLIAEAGDVVLCTSHLSPEECLVLIPAAKQKGIKHVIATHPSSKIIGASIEQQQEMVAAGAYMEHCFGYCLPKPTGPGLDIRVIYEQIKAVGAENCVLSSDMGIWYAPSPVEGLRMFVELLLQCGLSQEEIDVMIKENPARILGLDG